MLLSAISVDLSAPLVQAQEVLTRVQEGLPCRQNGQALRRSQEQRQDLLHFRRALHRLRYLRQEVPLRGHLHHQPPQGMLPLPFPSISLTRLWIARPLTVSDPTPSSSTDFPPLVPARSSVWWVPMVSASLLL